jgi:hypothetical protein
MLARRGLHSAAGLCVSDVSRRRVAIQVRFQTTSHSMMHSNDWHPQSVFASNWVFIPKTSTRDFGPFGDTVFTKMWETGLCYILYLHVKCHSQRRGRHLPRVFDALPPRARGDRALFQTRLPLRLLHAEIRRTVSGTPFDGQSLYALNFRRHKLHVMALQMDRLFCTKANHHSRRNCLVSLDHTMQPI